MSKATSITDAKMTSNDLTFKENFLKNIANLPIAYFALVMATGIVSIAAQLFDFKIIAQVLFNINIGLYILLCLFYLLRLVGYTKNFLADFTDPAKSPGLLTFVAATCIIGNQFIIINNNFQFATYMLVIGAASWIFLIYAFFTVVTIKKNKPTLENTISGLWLLVIVSTQAVSVLVALMANHFPEATENLLFFSLLMFLCGCMFYIVIITLIIYRLSFFEIKAEEFAPPYWINMGAVAITTLAGSSLILNADHFELLTSLLPFLKGFTLFFWAFGTWWIPLIVGLGIWRHVVKHLPLKYQPQYWGMIFPIGMYTVCTERLSHAIEMPFLHYMSSLFVYVAMGAWAIAFAAMLFHIVKSYVIPPKKI